MPHLFLGYVETTQLIEYLKAADLKSRFTTFKLQIRCGDDRLELLCKQRFKEELVFDHIDFYSRHVVQAQLLSLRIVATDGHRWETVGGTQLNLSNVQVGRVSRGEYPIKRVPVPVESANPRMYVMLAFLSWGTRETSRDEYWRMVHRKPASSLSPYLAWRRENVDRTAMHKKAHAAKLETPPESKPEQSPPTIPSETPPIPIRRGPCRLPDGTEVDFEKYMRLVDLTKVFPHYPEKALADHLQEHNWDVVKVMDDVSHKLLATASFSQTALHLKSTAKLRVRQSQLTNSDMSYAEVAAAPPADVGVRQQPSVGGPLPKLTGKKKALLIGINYTGSNKELSGCQADVGRWRKVLTELYGFSDDSSFLTTLVDTHHGDPRYRPTKKNILLAFQWLVADAEPGDALFFHFSGHGSQIRDHEGTEEDGFDETIMPVDYKTAGQIRDDEINWHLVYPLPSGVKMICVMDCCHSGSGMDLPFVWEPRTRSWKEERFPKKAAGDVVLLSGCQDNQTSADVKMPNVGTGGALTMALMTLIVQDPYNIRFHTALEHLNKCFRSRKLPQVPNLSSMQKFCITRPLDFLDILPNNNASIPQRKPPSETPLRARRRVQSDPTQGWVRLGQGRRREFLR
ncbi:MAG: uncharacterized protein KVP18_001873 [Porospora cf. gigantea A]|uniref:uncharacterized protein n=1 Tax=Porospora cf. gigantea A TaxID=2853593 RepID=UPI00355A0E55|nr:MAG: hypothetical protein KVP18_001873 [Porospora cf. gigantea A]